MQFPPVPHESRSQIDRAGTLLASESQYIGEVENARLLVAKWRACHLKPLQALADDLQQRLERLGIRAVVARRLKRLFRIRNKLRQSTSMRLTQMQDIGALRAIVNTIDEVHRLQKDYEQHPPAIAAELKEAGRDYIANAKESGYRSLHMVFAFNEKPPSEYNGIRIELQIRTQSQHWWACAVEVAGLRFGEPLKYDDGNPCWADFFRLSGEALARNERAPRASAFADYNDADLLRALRGVQVECDAVNLMRMARWPTLRYHADKDTRDAGDDGMVLLRLDVPNFDLIVTFYPSGAHDEALAEYSDAEQNQSFESGTTSVVLVRVSTRELLQQAYPTFFLDFGPFLDAMEPLLAGETPE